MTTGADAEKNFLVVDNKTDNATIESTFDRFIERKDIAIVLINQHASQPATSDWRTRAKLTLPAVRLPTRYATASTRTPLPSQPSWKYRAKTTPTILRKTVCCGESVAFSESKINKYYGVHMEATTPWALY